MKCKIQFTPAMNFKLTCFCGFFLLVQNLAINDAEPWFPENQAKKDYITLLQQIDPEATDEQLMKALLIRAMEGVVRVLSMREDKQVLSRLVKQGTVGDDIWTEFTLSEKELEAEIIAIIEEANTFKDGWGQTILKTASDMVRGLFERFIESSFPQQSFFLRKTITPLEQHR